MQFFDKSGQIHCNAINMCYFGAFYLLSIEKNNAINARFVKN